MKRTMRAIATTTAALVLATGVGLAAATAPARASEKVTIAIPANALLFAPLFIAHDAGLWADQGLDVELPLIAGPGATNAVIAGSADFTSSGGGSMLRAAARGQKLLAIANTIDQLLLELVVSDAAIEKFGVKVDGDFASRVRSLKGMTIAVDTVNGLPHGYLRYIAKKAGLDPETDVTVTAMQPPNMLAALKSGAVDAFIFGAPFIDLAVKGGGKVLIRNPIDDAPELNPFAYNLIVTQPEYCGEHAGVCEKLIAGLRQASRQMIEQGDAMLEVLRPRFARIPEDVLAASFRTIAAATNPSLRVTAEAMKSTEDYVVAAGMLKEDERIVPLSQLFTQDYTK